MSLLAHQCCYTYNKSDCHLSSEVTDNGAGNCSASASLHRTNSWVASTHEFMPYPVHYQDPQPMVPDDQTTGPALPPQEPTPSICDNLSELSDVSDARQSPKRLFQTLAGVFWQPTTESIHGLAFST